MNDLKFKYIAAENFMPFGPKGIEIDFTKLGNIVCIKGENHDRKNLNNDKETMSKNGVGKSSIANIISYTLYGKIFNSNGKLAQENVINNKIGKKLKTEVRWGKYRVIRTRKPNSLRIWESENEVWEDHTEISLGGIPATQILIEEKIGLSFEAFVNTVVFTDNNSCSFLECDTPTKRQIVENLLSLGHYREYAEKAKKIKNSHKEKISSMAKDYERILIEFDIAKKRIDSVKTQEEEWKKNKQKELDNLNYLIKLKQEEMTKSDNGSKLLAYNEAQEKISSLNESLPTFQTNIEKLKTMTNAAETKQEPLRKEKDSLSSQLQIFKLELNKLNSEINNEKLNIASFSSMKDTVCTRCKGIVKEENFIETINSSNEIIKKNSIEVEHLSRLIKEFDEKINIIKSDLAILERTISAIQEKSREVNNKMVAARTKILELSKIQRPQAGTDERVLQEKIESLKTQIISKKQEIEGISPYAEIIKSSLNEFSIKQNEVSQRKLELISVEKELPYYEFWVKAFGDSGIRKFVIDGIIPALNSQIAYWMQFLIDGKIKLTFDNELNELIESSPSDGDPYIYYAMSGGERRRLNLAVSQAFAYVMMLNSGQSPSIVFLDEVTTNIDPQGVEGVFNMIQELAKTKQVFITTHDHDLLEILSNYQSINLIRKDGFTTIRE